VCVCSLRYPAYNAHASYYLWPSPLYTIFPRCLINGTIFANKLMNTKCVFWFPLQLWNIFHSKKNWARCDKKMYIGLYVKCPLFLSDFNETWIFSTVFRKILNPLNAELNPICHLLALLGVHHFLYVSRIRVKSLKLRLLMSYIYIYIYIWSTYSWCF